MSKKAEFENLDAFRHDWDRNSEVCKAKHVVNATGICGPCTWGESETVDGNWWGKEDENRWKKLAEEAGSA